MHYSFAPLPSPIPVVVAACLTLFGCNRNVVPAKSPAAAKDVVARVNGAPITEFDLRQENRGHSPTVTGPQRLATMDAVIRAELLAQYAVEKGIDQDPLFQERMARAEALYRSARRRELADVLFRRLIVEQASATDEDAEAYYKANEKRMRTELHVLQILTRDEAQAKRVLDQIQSGQSFEEVAAKQFDTLPAGASKPWDLGFLRWRQMPPPWRNTLFDLAPGSVTGIIKGEAGRFWILKIADRREDSAANIESMKPAILEELKAKTVEHERARLIEDLRRKANVVIEDKPAPPPSPHAE